MAAYASLVSLMHTVDNLQLHPRPPISLCRKQAESLIAKVSFLLEFLEDYNPHLAYSTEADPLEIHIADAAYAAEDIIESHIVDSITNDGNKMSSDGVYQALEKVIEEMEVIKKEAMDIKQTALEVNHQLHTKSTPQDSSKSSSSMVQLQQRRMVGADDAMLEMKDKLTSDRLALQIIPIVGMGGSGKTTLARNLYQDRLIKDHFRTFAWVTISQEFSIREILEQILKQLDIQVSQNLSEGELGDILHKHLYGRKYMIVLDDMWSIRAWEGVRMFLPNTTNGSRIVVTTRLSNLASRLPNSSSLKMNLLDEADSWDLLSKTVFGEKDCPPELEEIGKEIGKSCKGLGLSIVVVGGFLAKSKHTREFWEYIQENINSIVNLEDNERCLKILHMSYKQLPVYLKPCFLYMGVFPEDEVIRVSSLIKLWVAEGFLKRVNRKSLEVIGREYLKDLVDRNLVLVDEMGSTGNIKKCQIHDLLRDLCLREGKKERFYPPHPQGIVNKPGKLHEILREVCLREAKKERSYTPNPQGKVNDQRWIVITCTETENEATNALSSMSLLRSFTWNGGKSHILPPFNFRLLRILQSYEYSKEGSTFSESMHQLVNSRFLVFSSGFQGCKFPSSIWLFRNLQTIIVKGFSEATAPTDIWYMPHIRHLQFERLSLPDPPNSQDDNTVLGNLQTLGTIQNFKCSMVKRIPNIKKVRICGSYGRYCLSNLGCLDKLESFSCFFLKGSNPSGLPDSSVHSLINFPHSLKKLTLQSEDSQYCWQDILDKVGSLPRLQKLKLQGGRFREGKWETTEGQFRSLKFLGLLYCTGIKHWKTESSHFPCLERLLLCCVYNLEEIPLSLADIATLRMIDVELCDSAVESAKRIVEEQEDLYGEEAALQVQVRLRLKNEALESLASTNFRFKWLSEV